MRRNKNSENITKRKWLLAKYFLSKLSEISNFNSPKTKVVWPQNSSWFAKNTVPLQIRVSSSSSLVYSSTWNFVFHYSQIFITSLIFHIPSLFLLEYSIITDFQKKFTFLILLINNLIFWILLLESWAFWDYMAASWVRGHKTLKVYLQNTKL